MYVPVCVMFTLIYICCVCVRVCTKEPKVSHNLRVHSRLLENKKSCKYKERREKRFSPHKIFHVSSVSSCLFFFKCDGHCLEILER